MKNSEQYQPKFARRTRPMSIRGVDYSINEWGADDAQLLVYLHGWADTGSSFQFVVDALTPDWHVIAPDWRGFGRSSCQCDAFWFPDYLADLHAILNAYSAVKPVRLLGHSMGGNIAALYAGTMPERVADFVNIEGFGLPDSDPQDAPLRYRSWLDAGDSPAAFSTYADFLSLAAKIQKRSPSLTATQADFVARQWAYDDDGVIRLHADPGHKRPNAVLYRRAEAEACWRNISARTLLLSGDQSPFRTQFGPLEALPFPDSQSHIIEGAGHMIHFDAPARLADCIGQFLRKSL